MREFLLSLPYEIMSRMKTSGALEIVGEASNNILRAAPDVAAAHAEIPWQIMSAMRNRVSHDYHTVDLEIVWKTVRQDLPKPYGQVRTLAGERRWNQPYASRRPR